MRRQRRISEFGEAEFLGASFHDAPQSARQRLEVFPVSSSKNELTSGRIVGIINKDKGVPAGMLFYFLPEPPAPAERKGRNNAHSDYRNQLG